MTKPPHSPTTSFVNLFIYPFHTHSLKQAYFSYIMPRPRKYRTIDISITSFFPPSFFSFVFFHFKYYHHSFFPFSIFFFYIMLLFALIFLVYPFPPPSLFILFHNPSLRFLFFSSFRFIFFLLPLLFPPSHIMLSGGSGGGGGVRQ
jgi:hypothetical protein